MNTYWFSVFERTVDSFTALGSKEQHLFRLFVIDSISRLKSLLPEVSSQNSGDGISHLKSIHGLTKNNVFQGFVLNLKFGGIEYETFHTIEFEKNIETITNHFGLDHQDAFNQSVCLREHHEFFFKYLHRIQVRDSCQ
jgi:hypothetical protein